MSNKLIAEIMKAKGLKPSMASPECKPWPTDMNAAMELVDEMVKDQWLTSMYPYNNGWRVYSAGFVEREDVKCDNGDIKIAICEAYKVYIAWKAHE